MSFIDNFLRGQALAEQEHKQAQDEEYETQRRKLEMDVAKHQLQSMKISDALQKFAAINGRPAKETQGTTQVDVGKPGMSKPEPSGPAVNGSGMPGAPYMPSSIAQGFTQTVPTVQEEPLPEVTIPFEGGDVALQPTSLQENLRKQFAAKVAEKRLDAAFAVHPVAPNTKLVTGTGQTVATGNAPEPTGELKEFAEIGLPAYAAKVGKTVEQLTDQEKGAAFTEFVRSKQQPRLLTPEEEAQQMRIRKAAAIGGLPPQAQTRVQSLSNSFDTNPIVKSFNESVTKLQTVSALLNGNLGGPGDLAIVYEFMKGLDPTSVVRESEYAAAAASGNIFKGAFAKFNGYLKPEGGFLPPDVRQAFYKILQTKLAAGGAQVKRVYTDFGRRIDLITGQPGTGTQYLTDYTQGVASVGGGNAANPYR